MKKRLDQLLIDKNLTESREKGKRLILSGEVLVNESMVDKVGTMVDEDSDIRIKQKFPYVSRGALKLEKAYKEFKLDFKDKIVCDVGSSTGGFTDFALQHKAKKVYAIDVGYGQLDQKLRNNPKVVVMERTNIKKVDSWSEFSKRVILASKTRPESKKSIEDSGQAGMTEIEPIDIFLIDVSFISLKRVLPVVKKLLNKNSEVIALIKPQFEVGKKIADKFRGVIKDSEIQKGVVSDIKNFAKNLGFKVKGIVESPIKGAKGNKEFLIWLGNK